MRRSIIGIPLILLYATLGSMCDSGTGNADQSKFQEIERMWGTMPLYPGFVEVSTQRASTDESAHINKSFNFTGPYEKVRQFYVERLTHEGWQIVKERRMSDWWRDFGGQQLSFEKEGYKLSIEYAGESGNKGWDYGIGIYWRDL